MQQSFPAPRPTTNPYLVMLAESIAREPGVSVRTFSWRAALFGSYDVLHVHWPDILVTGGSPLKTFGRQALTAGLLLRLRMLGVPLVRTVHNPVPHAPADARAGALLAAIDRSTALWICLNDSTAPGGGRASVVIPHGHYRDWFGRVARASAILPVPGRIAHVGLIRPYKGIESLVDAFRGVGRVDSGEPAASLCVAGAPRSVELADRLRRLAELDARVQLVLRHLDDAELMRVVGEAELIVLPHRDMHNSGSALAALSLDRPVLVPRNDVNERLSAEVGPGWVYQFDGTLTAETLERTLVLARAGVVAESVAVDARSVEAEGDVQPRGYATAGPAPDARSDVGAPSTLLVRDRAARPDLSRRDWTDTGARHVAAYREAIALQRARRRPAGGTSSTGGESSVGGTLSENGTRSAGGGS